MNRAAEIHAKFFPPAAPVCRFTRQEIMEASEKARQRKREKRFQTVLREQNKLSAERSRRATPHIANDEPIHISAPVRDIKILQVAATMYGVSVRELVGTRRSQYLTFARAYAASRLRYELDRSYPQISTLFRRDHTTIMNLVHPREGTKRGGRK